MKTTHVVKILGLFAFVCILSSFSKCKNGGTEDPNAQYARVRFFHAAPDVAKLAFLANGKTQNPDSTAYNNGTEYAQVEVVNDKKTVLAISAKGAILGQDSLALKTDSTLSYSVFAFQDADKSIKTTFATDNLLPPTAGKARLRVAHFIPDLSNLLDVELAAPNAAASTKRDFPNLTFRTVTNFLDVPAGSHDIKVKLSGQTTSVVPAPTAKGVAVFLEAGKTYTVILRGFINRANSAGLTLVKNK